MVKPYFFYTVVKNNFRRMPLAVVLLSLTVGFTFTLEAWLVRLVYGVDFHADSTYVGLTALIQSVSFLFLLYIYNYYLTQTGRRYALYRRLGASLVTVAAAMVFESVLLVLTGLGCGSLMDTLLNVVAPRNDVVRFLEWGLFGWAAGFTLIPPAAVLITRPLIMLLLRCARRAKNTKNAAADEAEGKRSA